MENTILYYPNIEIPTTGTWIRRALLYWDKLAAIVPRSYDDYMNAQGAKWFRPELQELYELKVFRPINPGLLFRSGSAAMEFERDWRKIHAMLKRRFRNKSVECAIPIYKDKTSNNVFYDLERSGLAQDIGHPLLYFFEPITAELYMALLAKHIAAAERVPTVPATDNERLSDQIFGKGDTVEPESVLVTRLSDVIPVPSPSVKLNKILKFRDKYQAELISFRDCIKQFEEKLSAQGANEKLIKSETEAFKNRITKETQELGRALKSIGIQTGLGSLQAFIKPNAPALIGSAAVVAGKATSLAAVPISWVIAGAATAGLIEVGMHCFGKAQDRRAALKGSAFAYLFLARKKLVRL